MADMVVVTKRWRAWFLEIKVNKAEAPGGYEPFRFFLGCGTWSEESEPHDKYIDSNSTHSSRFS